MRAALLSVLLLSLPASAFAWGTQGHRIIATIAAQRLTPATRAKVDALLAHNSFGKTLPAISTWADQVRFREMPETTHWHFVDIPLSRDNYDPGRDCRYVPGKGDCIIAALQRMRDVLADPHRKRIDRVEALAFVVHLVGDLHQPLHAAERDDDLGGNKVKIRWLGQVAHRNHGERQEWNLHAVWDDGLISASQRGTAQTVVQLNAWLATQDEASIRSGSIVDWALETHTVARQLAYRDADGRSIPPHGARLGRDYYKARIGVVDGQLAKAGVRLAAVLNEALR